MHIDFFIVTTFETATMSRGLRRTLFVSSFLCLFIGQSVAVVRVSGRSSLIYNKVDLHLRMIGGTQL
jgi:hypothetical protein